MILIISGTNRVGSNTLRVAKVYQKIIKEKGEDVQLLSLENLKSIEKDANFKQMEENYLIPATKIFIIAPEYNGSFPGILKLMIDLSDIKQVFYGKKLAITGVANGRAGNLRGLDHLTNIFHYLKMHILPNKLPISGISNLLVEEEAEFRDTATLQSIHSQIDEFIKF